MAKKRVLLVDDQPDLAIVLAAAFERAGFAAMTASDGSLALEEFNSRPSDVVVTDIIMPNREGFETVRDLRRLSPSVVIIAMSGGGRIGPTALRDIAIGLGADAFIAKPFRPSEIVALTQQKLTERESLACAVP